MVKYNNYERRKKKEERLLLGEIKSAHTTRRIRQFMGICCNKICIFCEVKRAILASLFVDRQASFIEAYLTFRIFINHFSP